MKQPSQKQKRILRRGIMAAVLSGLAISASADQVTVHKSVDVLADKNPFADPVETVQNDAKLDVVSTDGSWVKVRTAAGKEGYVTSDDIAVPKGLSGVAANDQAGIAMASAAGRGLDDDSKEFARQKNLKLDGVNAMVAMGTSVTRADLRNFGKEGHVGPTKYRNKN